MYSVSIIGSITSFMKTRTHLFGLLLARACFAYEQGVMSMSTYDMAVRMHNAGETLSDGNCYYLSREEALEGSWVSLRS